MLLVNGSRNLYVKQVIGPKNANIKKENLPNMSYIVFWTEKTVIQK